VSQDQSIINYRDIPGFPGYKAGDDGSVWSTRRGEPRRLAATLSGYALGHGRGHWSVCLSVPGSRQVRRYVHRLVLLAFVGDPPLGTEACHNDGNRDNNRLSNLRWDTRISNVSDAERDGQRQHPSIPGERNGRAVLTEEKVSEVRRLLGTGLTQGAVAKIMGVSRSQIGNIGRGEHWKSSHG
jgi:DNA-binding XRE family transcriptional regulator